MLSLLLLLTQLSTAHGLEPPDPSQTVPVSLLGPGFLEPVFPMSPALRGAIVARDHAGASAELERLDPQSLHGNQAGDRAFVLAWSLTRDGRPEEAIPLLPAIAQAQHVPQDYIQLTVGELQVADDRLIDGAQTLLKLDPSSPNRARAVLVAAQALHDAGSTQQALELWEELAARPDPAEGSEIALLAIAKKKGLSSDRAYSYLRRLWAHYPSTKEGRQAAKSLASLESKASKYKPTSREIALHGESLMNAWQFRSAIDYLSPRISVFDRVTPSSCVAWYAYGRSNYKLNAVTRAADILRKSGEKCAGIDEDRGAKSFYLAGKSLERKKEWADAARAYQRIPELYPDHSMADDGYALAGIAWQEAGKPELAKSLWARQVSEYPDGDLAAEGFWRLAWTAYLDGDPTAAIDWAELMIWKVPVETSPMHWMGAHYWSARWRIYPDVANPSEQNMDDEQVQIGILLLTDLVERYPSRFYSLLAAARLYELDPSRVATIPRPTPAGHPNVWTVREAFLEEENVQRGLQLVRLGLVREALSEFDSIPTDHLLPSEVALIAEIEREWDWTKAHDRLHHYLLHHPAAELGPDRDRLLREAYPSSYWEVIQKVADGYRYDPGIFRALVREESSFNPANVSHAGARGLSQLMPATARQVAGWLGIPITNAKMFDPETNLTIGSRYLEYLHKFFSDNHMLAVAAYNAGEGNVQKWHKRTGNIPTDEFVESIPFRETRRYVKRVLGTYQLYRMVYGQGTLYPDWSALNHQAIVD